MLASFGCIKPKTDCWGLLGWSCAWRRRAQHCLSSPFPNKASRTCSWHTTPLLPPCSCKAGGSYGLRASFYSQQSCKAKAAQQRSPPQSWPEMSSVGEGEVLRVTAQRPAPHTGPGDEPQRRQKKKTHLFYWSVIKLTTRRSREAPGSIERALAAQAASPAAAPGPGGLHPTAVGDRQRFQSWQGTAAPATWATRAFLLPALAPLLPNPPTVPARKGKGFKCRRRSEPGDALPQLRLRLPPHGSLPADFPPGTRAGSRQQKKNNNNQAVLTRT